MKPILSLCFLAFLVLPAGAQEESKPEPEKVEVSPEGGASKREIVLHEVELRSGTVLVGTIEPTLLRIDTEFGRLTVPIAQMRSVRFGTLADAARHATLLELIENLGSRNPDRARHAQAQLNREGAFAADELRRAAASHDNPEVRRVCGEVFGALELEEERIVPRHDRIDTTLFALNGRVVQDTFRVTVPELDGLDIRRSDVIEIRVFKRVAPKNFELDGDATYVGGWVDTGIVPEKDTRLRISAEGTIHYPRWGNQFVTPDGNPNMGNLNGINMGTLIGKMGENGTFFKIGRNYSGRPQGKGTLRIAIMINVRGQPSTGKYSVRIEQARGR
jgi:hypothetical protein